MLVLEGVMLLLFPAVWRSMLEKVLRLHDGQIRFFGLGSLLAGLIFMFVLST